MAKHPPGASTSRAPWSGDLTFPISCRTSRDAASGRRHALTIRDDWSVLTSHDLQAERIASAFGGYSSCLELVDRTIPRMRESLRLVARQTRPALRRDKRGDWRVPAHELVECCRNHAFPSVRSTVGHLRSPEHLANLLGLPLWQVRELVTAVSGACRPELGPASPSAHHVREPEGLEQLWQAGIHPTEVPRLASFASVVHEPLPTTYFEGVAYSGHRPDWLDDVLAYRPDADTAAWLAWHAPPDAAGDAADWGPWLGYGLPRQDFTLAVDKHVPAEIVTAVQEKCGWPLRTAARVVLAFARADCAPTPDQLTVIARLGLEHAIPGKAAVDAAAEDALRAGMPSDRTHPIDRTELGLMLAVAGNRPMLLAALRRGARTVSDLDPRGDPR